MEETRKVKHNQSFSCTCSNENGDQKEKIPLCSATSRLDGRVVCFRTVSTPSRLRAIFDSVHVTSKSENANTNQGSHNWSHK